MFFPERKARWIFPGGAKWNFPVGAAKWIFPEGAAMVKLLLSQHQSEEKNVLLGKS